MPLNVHTVPDKQLLQRAAQLRAFTDSAKDAKLSTDFFVISVSPQIAGGDAGDVRLNLALSRGSFGYKPSQPFCYDASLQGDSATLVSGYVNRLTPHRSQPDGKPAATPGCEIARKDYKGNFTGRSPSRRSKLTPNAGTPDLFNATVIVPRASYSRTLALGFPVSLHPGLTFMPRNNATPIITL